MFDVLALSFSQAASLPMSIIIVGVGPAEFDGKPGEEHVCADVCVGV